MAGNSASSSSWRTPSAANQAKFSLVPLPDDFEPTEEEQGLLSMYETIRNYERQAARLKELKAREKLAVKEAEFKQNMAPKRKRNRAKKEKTEETAGSDDEGDESSVEDASDAGSDNEDPQSLEERRAAKLEALRDEVEEAKQAMVSEETKQEDLREKLLSTNEDVDLGPALKKKRLKEPAEGKTLLTSMMKMKTPPHDFSERLGLKPWKGKVLFPATPDESRWAPPAQSTGLPNDGALLVELENFDIGKAQQGSGNNTVAVKFNAPADSKRFRYDCSSLPPCRGDIFLTLFSPLQILFVIIISINIAGPGHDEFNSVLFHFNPRQHERGGQLVVNDKQEGIWGQAIALPLSQVPLIFGQTAVTLVIQINGDGFDIFIEDKHCARLEHRKELPSKPCSLFLQFPSCDDYGSKCVRQRDSFFFQSVYSRIFDCFL